MQVGSLQFTSNVPRYLEDKDVRNINFTNLPLEVKKLTKKEVEALKSNGDEESSIPQIINDETVKEVVEVINVNLHPKYDSILGIIPNQVPGELRK